MRDATGHDALLIAIARELGLSLTPYVTAEMRRYVQLATMLRH